MFVTTFKDKATGLWGFRVCIFIIAPWYISDAIYESKADAAHAGEVWLSKQ